MKETLFGTPLPARALTRAREALGARDGIGKSPEDRYILRILETRSRHAETRKVGRVRRALSPREGNSDEWKKLRDKADAAFSKYIRKRDTKIYEGAQTRAGRCVTCKEAHFYEALQCGHWISRRKWGTRWHEMNAHAQCAGCNKWGGGRPQEHEYFISVTHGQGYPDHLRAVAKLHTKKPTIYHLKGIIQEFERKLGALV